MVQWSGPEFRCSASHKIPDSICRGHPHTPFAVAIKWIRTNDFNNAARIPGILSAAAATKLELLLARSLAGAHGLTLGCCSA